MTDSNNSLPRMEQCYGILPSMLRKFDRYARRDSFRGDTRGEFEQWRSETRSLLHGLLGLDKMEDCGLSPVLEGVLLLPGGIRREHIRIQVEPDVWMPMFVLVPPGAGCSSRPFICPPGHNGAGKYSVAGLDGYGPVRDKIRQYHYDYGYQLAKLGYVAVCPDCRGFGERREDLEDTKDAATAMKGDCYRLAHMGEPLGIPVAGMLAWDLMRVVDYLMERGEWDMGDIASLIAPRPLLIQSCRGDRLNGPRGIVNAAEQVDIIRNAYRLTDAPGLVIHEICEGPHQWHGENLAVHLGQLIDSYEEIKTNQEVFHG